MDNGKISDADRIKCMQATLADTCNSARQPTFIISAGMLSVAIVQAERAADDLDLRIKEQSAERDKLVRQAGALQEMIDAAKREHSRLMRHVHDLRNAAQS